MTQLQLVRNRLELSRHQGLSIGQSLLHQKHRVGDNQAKVTDDGFPPLVE
jgi:hypothetical protein